MDDHNALMHYCNEPEIHADFMKPACLTANSLAILEGGQHDKSRGNVCGVIFLKRPHIRENTHPF